MAEELDTLIVGSGFAGCLTAMIARRYGYRVALFDRRPHPRFAVGESTTPLGSNLLAAICDEHRLPALRPLSEYGTARRMLPDVTVGLKRGFTYVRHDPGREPDVNGGDLLMFAASSADAISDTHWLRSEVDAFAADCAAQQGAPVRIVPDLTVRVDGRYRVNECSAGNVIDATGSDQLALSVAGTKVTRLPRASFRTRSSAVYTHIRGFRRLTDCCDIRGAVPFDPDAAAVHHLLEEGWMWQLRFDDGRVSVGMCFADGGRHSEEDVRAVILRYPMLQRQFQNAVVCESPGRWIAASPLQRRLANGPPGGWGMLPSSFGFVDPMHSTGIALNLAQVARWGRAICEASAEGRPFPQLPSGPLAEEQAFVDALVSLAYRTRRDMRAFEAAASLHVAAAMTCEGMPDPDRPQLVSGRIAAAAAAMHAVLDDAGGEAATVRDELRATACAAVEEIGVRCLFDETATGRYAATAAR